MFTLAKSFVALRSTLGLLCEANFPSRVRRCLHTDGVLYKQRRTKEERKAAAKTGRNVIKYSLKAKPKNEAIGIWRNMTVAEVASACGKSTDQVFEAMLYTKNSENYSEETSPIDNPKVIYDILKILGYRYKIVPKPRDLKMDDIAEEKDATRNPPASPENLRPRPPIITVMGHVDHGKTTLLDSLRNTNVVEREFGGITQHIGAFEVRLSGDASITFMDTPGHAAFSAMRARGANATDIVILVVAADDGVMEQTVESIRMAREAKVPIIVAINKIDKPSADIERTKKMLALQGIIVEDMGGEIQAIPVSALKKTNLANLIEAISLQAQIMDLKADPTGPVEGVVIEAETDQRRGKLATVIVQRGTLRKGCILVAGTGWARVRAMFSSDGSPVSEAPPSAAVQVLGWRELPSSGDEMLEVESVKRAGEVIRWRTKNKMQEKMQIDSVEISKKEAEHRAVYEEYLRKKRLMGRFKLRREGPREKMFIESNEPMLNIIVKGDVHGSVEAILDVLETYDDDKCKLDVVHYGIGNVSENDVELAEIFKGILYAFNVEVLPNVKTVIKSKKIKIKHFNVIYKMVDDIKQELNLRVPISQTEEEIGVADVLENFVVNEKRKKVFVAGCKCVRGVLKRNELYKVYRGDELLFNGKLDSMRHLKDEVDTIKKDTECGLKLVDKTVEFKPGDQIICYRMVDVQTTVDWNPGF